MYNFFLPRNCNSPALASNKESQFGFEGFELVFELSFFHSLIEHESNGSKWKSGEFKFRLALKNDIFFILFTAQFSGFVNQVRTTMRCTQLLWHCTLPQTTIRIGCNLDVSVIQWASAFFLVVLMFVYKCIFLWIRIPGGMETIRNLGVDFIFFVFIIWLALRPYSLRLRLLFTSVTNEFDYLDSI